MDDEQILLNGGTEEDIKKYAEQNGADLTKEDVGKSREFRKRLAQIRDDGFHIPVIVENIVLNELLLQREEMAANLKIVVSNLFRSGTDSEYMDGHNACVKEVVMLINKIFYEKIHG